MREKFGIYLRNARLSRGADFTQEKLARSVGIKRSTLANIEGGRHAPSLHLLHELARELEIPSATLIDLLQ